MAPCGSPWDGAGKEGESSTLYVAVIFYGLSRIMLERESALPTIYKAFQKFSIFSSHLRIFTGRAFFKLDF